MMEESCHRRWEKRARGGAWIYEAGLSSTGPGTEWVGRNGFVRRGEPPARDGESPPKRPLNISEKTKKGGID